MSFKLLLIPGDGIGPEIMEGPRQIFRKISQKNKEKVELSEALAGGAAIRKVGIPLPPETIQAAKEADAVLLGAVGHPDFDQIAPEIRPEQAILGLRKELELYANLRPVDTTVIDLEASPLKADRISGVDFIVVRELVGGIYFGDRHEGEIEAWDIDKYTAEQVERIARSAAQIAQSRRKKVTSVDKANVLATSRLWRSVVERVFSEYPEISLEHMYVDNCAMQLVTHPKEFDVILTSNLFGDILSDEAAVLTGSLGMMPSASLGTQGGLYEPIHGSAPDIAGRNIANPLGMILSAALCCELTLNRLDWGRNIRQAVQKVWQEGWRTADMTKDAARILGTREMIERVVDRIE